MSDESVHAALRSDARLVVVEAPAGCGKTYQGAAYARELAGALSVGRPLVLTHTHAACSVFAEATREVGRRIDIRTIDSIIGNIAHAYHDGLDLPEDIAGWVRQTRDGHGKVAAKVATLLTRHPMIAASLARRHPIVICDEHQDSSADQHTVVMSLLKQGARLRVFGDPMQEIFREDETGTKRVSNWEQITKQADTFEKLDYPHRWKDGCPDLGSWTLRARADLKAGGRIDLRGSLPSSVQVIKAENAAQAKFDFHLPSKERQDIDAFKDAHDSMLILTHYNAMTHGVRRFFYRTVPLWEGHTRKAFEKLTRTIESSKGDAAKLAAAITKFLGSVGKGFSPSAFGNQFEKEAREGCTRKRRLMPATLQQLARFLVDEPDHRGVSKMLRRLADLRKSDPAFIDVVIDCHKEFWDAVNLGSFETIDAGLAELAHRRSYSHPKPPPRSISTIHKAKGLECDAVMLVPCDGQTFPDTAYARCVLYVALSRAMSRLLIVVSREKPSPLLVI
jgi:hypothetical protein